MCGVDAILKTVFSHRHGRKGTTYCLLLIQSLSLSLSFYGKNSQWKDRCLFVHCCLWVCAQNVLSVGKSKAFYLPRFSVTFDSLSVFVFLAYVYSVMVFFSFSSLPLIIITSIRLSWLWVHCLLFCCHLKIIKFTPDIYSHPSLRGCLTDILSFKVAH